MKKYLSALFLLLPLLAATQTCEEKIAIAKKNKAKGDYRLALKQFNAAAADCGSARSGEIEQQVLDIYDRIEGLKKEAERQTEVARRERENAFREKEKAELAEANARLEKEKATSAEKIANEEAERARIALANLEIQKALTDSALQKAEKLINAFYFYGDRFALAYNNSLFYFINRNGDQVEKLGSYNKAEQFDETGFAAVTMKNDAKIIEYYLDTFGTTYPTAYTISDLNNRMLALDLSERQLRKFPAEIPQNPQLVILKLNGKEGRINRLMIPPSIDKMNQLKVLFLSRCRINKLPREFGQLTNLLHLNLYLNHLRELPPEFSRLTNLQTLDLSYNRLGVLPIEINRLSNLRVLDLSGNPISVLPSGAGLWQMKNLQTLRLLYNRFSVLPPEIAQLSNLEALYLGGNQLSTLPPEFAQLQNLKTLGLGANQFSRLPIEVTELKNLQWLNLFNNKINSLPHEIRTLRSLKKLLLQGNPFSAEYIEQLRKDMPWCEIEF